jgi:hypothetical protein
MNIIAWIIAGAVALFAIVEAVANWMANNGINPFM